MVVRQMPDDHCYSIIERYKNKILEQQYFWFSINLL